MLDNEPKYIVRSFIDVSEGQFWLNIRCPHCFIEDYLQFHIVFLNVMHREMIECDECGKSYEFKFDRHPRY